VVRFTQSILELSGLNSRLESPVKSFRLAALAGIAATAVAASFLAPTATPADAAPSAGDPRLEAQAAATAWIKGHGNALERASADSFVRTGTFAGDAGVYSMAYERTHEGLRVVGGDFVVLANADGQVVGSSVAQEAPVDIASTTAKVDASRAATVAAAQVDQLSDASAPELVVSDIVLAPDETTAGDQ
jgi:Zn-dependent metalloprotease